MKKLIVLWLLLFPVIAAAQEIDSSGQVYQRVRDLLGQTDYSQFDTTGEMFSAVMAGKRAVAMDIGIVGYDTITIVAGTYNYTLNSNFMDRGLVKFPYRVTRITADGGKSYDVKPLPDGYGVTAAGTSGEFTGPEISGWAISGNRLWISPANPDGDKLYVEGPADATGVVSAGFTMTDISEADRMAVVHFAVALLAASRNNFELANIHKTIYDSYVRARAGDYRVQKVQQ